MFGYWRNWCRDFDREGDKTAGFGMRQGIDVSISAEEVRATVFATDLWISATENFRRFEMCGMLVEFQSILL